MYQDAMEHPDAYEEDVVELLRRMVENRHLVDKLSDADAEKLNLATVEFYSASPGRKAPPPAATKTVQRVTEAPVEEAMDIPSNNAFWWT